MAAGRDFLRDLKEIRDVSAHTFRNYGADLSHFKQFVEKEIFKWPKEKITPPFGQRDLEGKGCSIPVEELDKKSVRNFIAALYYRGLKQRTLLRKLSTLRSFFRYLVRKQLIAFNPIEGIKSPKLTQSIPVTLSYTQVEHLLAMPDVKALFGCRDRCAMELFYSSGLRVSELISLDRADLDLGRRMIRVKGKGKKERLIPITRPAAKWVRVYLTHKERHLEGKGWCEKDRQAVFLNRFGTRLSTRSIDRMFQRYLIKSGLAVNATPHNIRHTIATHWLEQGMNIKTIQMLLGHSSPKATMLYTRVSTRLKREVYDKTHPRAKKEGEIPQNGVDSS